MRPAGRLVWFSVSSSRATNHVPKLWGSLVDNQLDEVDLRFILPPLANEGYIEESEGHVAYGDKGVKYMQTYGQA